MALSLSLASYLEAAPKAELHIHLEGTIQPETAFELAQRNGIVLPVKSVEELRRSFVYRDFAHFVESFLLLTHCLKTSEDYEQIVYELGAELARQNARYAEVSVTPSTHYQLGVPFEIAFAGMQRGRARVLTDFQVEINWIFTIVRQWADASRTVPMADYATSMAIEFKDEGVVALGLAGSEAGAPPETFAPWFARASAAGLHSAPHAGEHAGPASIWGALNTLRAERIAHGVRASEDPHLVAYLAEHHIPLDITPTSNISLGVCPSHTAHPLPQLHSAGIPITISTDDPPLFNTTLNQEIGLLATHFGLSVTEIDDIILNGIRCSFLEEERRGEVEENFRAEIAGLKHRYMLH